MARVVLVNNHKPGATMLNKLMAYHHRYHQQQQQNLESTDESILSELRSSSSSSSSLATNSLKSSSSSSSSKNPFDVINHNNIPIDLLATLLRQGKPKNSGFLNEI